PVGRSAAAHPDVALMGSGRSGDDARANTLDDRALLIPAERFRIIADHGGMLATQWAERADSLPDLINHQQLIWCEPAFTHGYSYFPWQHEPCLMGVASRPQAAARRRQCQRLLGVACGLGGSGEDR